MFMYIVCTHTHFNVYNHVNNSLVIYMCMYICIYTNVQIGMLHTCMYMYMYVHV